MRARVAASVCCAFTARKMRCQVPVSSSGVKAGACTVNSSTGPVMRSPVLADCRNVLRHHIDEGDVVAGALQPRADRTADRAGAPDQNPLGHHQLSSNARVSCTATSQISSISESSR